MSKLLQDGNTPDDTWVIVSASGEYQVDAPNVLQAIARFVAANGIGDWVYSVIMVREDES